MFNLVAHDHYERIPNYRDLTPEDEMKLAGQAPEPRDRHVHSRGRGDPPHRSAVMRLNGTTAHEKGQALLPARVSCTGSCAAESSRTITRSTRKTVWLLAAAEEESADLRSGLGRLHARQYFRRALHRQDKTSLHDDARPASST